MNPKILLIDIETSPNVAHVWGLFKQNVGINQLMDSSRTMCLAWKWYGENKINFIKERSPEKNQNVVDKAWELLDEADIIIHYNGKKFDIPTLNKEFILNHYAPPSPYKQVDLLSVAKKQFRFPSNKLDYVAKALGYTGKVAHEGHELWVRCMAGDKSAWSKMKEYNTHDVILLEEVYDRMLPWITNHPNMALYTNPTEPTCPNCGGTHLQKRGQQHTNVMSYQRYQCNDCGTWVRGRYNVTDKMGKGNIMTQVKG